MGSEDGRSYILLLSSRTPDVSSLISFLRVLRGLPRGSLWWSNPKNRFTFEMAGDEAVVSHLSSAEDNVVGSDKNEGVTVSAEGVVVDHGLHRALKQRHLQMIALGGVIGYVRRF